MGEKLDSMIVSVCGDLGLKLILQLASYFLETSASGSHTSV